MMEGGNGMTHHGGMMNIETVVLLHLEGIIVQTHLHPHCLLQHPQMLDWSPLGLVVAPLVLLVSAIPFLFFYFVLGVCTGCILERLICSKQTVSVFFTCVSVICDCLYYFLRLWCSFKEGVVTIFPEFVSFYLCKYLL
jgi:hypothetical protein